MSYLPIEETDLVKRLEVLSDTIWDLTTGWDWFAKRVIGVQLSTSIESVCANLVEGDGRYSDGDALHFFAIARGSLREGSRWLRAAHRRRLAKPDQFEDLHREMTELQQMLNGLINYRRRTKNQGMAREAAVDYDPYASRLTPNAFSQGESLED